MKKQLRTLTLALLVLVGIKTNAQFTAADVKYWIGSGSDSSVFVVSFNDAAWDSSYAWGYLYNDSTTGEEVLNAIAAADVNFSVNIGGGFLNDITYGSHAGIGGTNDFYWSTWSGTNIANMAMNMGLSETMFNGDWFACSYTTFDAVTYDADFVPSEPYAAFEPFRFTAQDIAFWVGTGTDTSLLVVDFLTASGGSSFAWGYLHDGTATAEDMLNDVAAADANFAVVIGGGFLNDITYNSFSGLGGSPNYWTTWSATNLGNWDMNMGIGTSLSNGDLFGCSYTDFAPVERPNYPAAAISNISIAENAQQNNLTVYPNPAAEFVNINFNNASGEVSLIKIIDVSGKTVFSQSTVASSVQIPVQQLANGFYTIAVSAGKTNYSKAFIKQ